MRYGVFQRDAFGFRFGLVFRGYFQRPRGTPVRKVWTFRPFLYDLRNYTEEE